MNTPRLHPIGGKSKAVPVLVGIAVSLPVLYFGAGVVLPVLISFFLFLLLDPVVERLERRHLPRAVGATLAIVVAMVVVSVTVFAFYNSLRRLATQVPRYSEKISTTARRLQGAVDRFEADFQRLAGAPVALRSAEKARGEDAPVVGPAPVQAPSSTLASFVMSGFHSAMSLVFLLFFIPLISLFLLVEKDSLQERFLRLFPDRAPVMRAGRELSRMSVSFFLGNFAVGIGMSILFAGVFRAMRLESAFQLALFAGFLNLIPIFGTILGAILPSLQAFLQFDGFSPIVLIATASLVIHFVANNVVMPKLLGNRVNVNATASMVGFLVWGTLWGALGLFLTIPLTAMLRIVFESREDWKPYGNLLAENLPRRKPQPERKQKHEAPSDSERERKSA